MVQKYETPVRRFTTPMTLVIVRTPFYKGGVPAKNVPLERRTGMVRVVYSSAMEVRGVGTEDGNYPAGASYLVKPGCEATVEVLQRGLSDAAYARLLQDPPYTRDCGIQRLPTGTPIIAPGECLVANKSASPRARIRLVPEDNLKRYLTNLLPLIGVATSEAGRVATHLEVTINQGKRELASW